MSSFALINLLPHAILHGFERRCQEKIMLNDLHFGGTTIQHSADFR